jgi:hypothetical protein
VTVIFQPHNWRWVIHVIIAWLTCLWAVTQAQAFTIDVSNLAGAENPAAPLTTAGGTRLSAGNLCLACRISDGSPTDFAMQAQTQGLHHAWHRVKVFAQPLTIGQGRLSELVGPGFINTNAAKARLDRADPGALPFSGQPICFIVLNAPTLPAATEWLLLESAQTFQLDPSSVISFTKSIHLHSCLVRAGTRTTGSLALTPLPSPSFAVWASAHLGLSPTAAADARTLLHDPDADGCPNLMEYIHGTRPLHPDAHLSGVTMRLTAQGPLFTWRQAPLPLGWTLVLQHLTSLGDWVPSGWPTGTHPLDPLMHVPALFPLVPGVRWGAASVPLAEVAAQQRQFWRIQANTQGL